MDSRALKLHGAGEIHRFNRDVEDALSRIQEKYAAVPADLGRDLKAVQRYLKKHESFENELVALEAQVTERAEACGTFESQLVPTRFACVVNITTCRAF